MNPTALTRAARGVRILGMLLALAVVTACGNHPAVPPPAKNPPPQVSIQFSVPTRLSALPFLVAEQMGFFTGITVRPSPAPASIRVGAPGGHWPIVGVLAERPDAFLAAPSPDPHFRLRSLRQLTIYYSPVETSNWPLVSRVLDHHYAFGAVGYSLSFGQIERLWSPRHLPWALVSLSQWMQLKASHPDTTLLSWIGAATGPIYHLVISADPNTPHLAAVLRGIDLGLWYVHTTRARLLAKLMASVYHQPVGRLAAEIAAARAMNFWPEAIIPTEPPYTRTAVLMSRQPPPWWPAYPTGVNPRPAESALSQP
ncbi:MAG: hypothetical protein M0Z53_03065 [Thermaerobacter sp.]|nr:hypothetical protein [Thermaerobacter sp.]